MIGVNEASWHCIWILLVCVCAFVCVRARTRLQIQMPFIILKIK